MYIMPKIGPEISVIVAQSLESCGLIGYSKSSNPVLVVFCNICLFYKKQPLRTLYSRFCSNQSNRRIQDFMYQMNEIFGSSIVSNYIHYTVIIYIIEYTSSA